MIEQIILGNLVENEKYLRKVIGYIEPQYFQDAADRKLFELIAHYVAKYNAAPSKQALEIDLANSTVTQALADAIANKINNLSSSSIHEEKWLLDQTEKWCQDKAIYNAILKSIEILDGKTDQDKGSLPSLLQQALGVSFDSHVGHDFFPDAEERFDFYHEVQVRKPFGLDILNKITQGGIFNKTLTVLLGGTGVGKTLFMCSEAAADIKAGRSVLYITAEMQEKLIAERIDANLLSTEVQHLRDLSREMYLSKLQKIYARNNGRLVVKEYPTSTVNANHIRHLLNELRIKRNFVPSVIYIDYINICASSRFRGGSNANSYTIVKAIAEEFRGLAVEFDVPVITATQVNRGGLDSSDLDLSNTSESIGLPFTADLMLAIVSNEELDQLNQWLIKQLKNRYNDPNFYRRFVVGVNKAKMTVYDVEQSAQEGLVKEPDLPVFDNTSFAQQPTVDHFAKLFD